MSLQKYPQRDFSSGPQGATSLFLRKPSEIEDIRNGRFGVEIGAIVRRLGSARQGNAFNIGSGDTDAKGGFIAKFSTGNIRFVAANNTDNTATVVRTQNSGTGVWTTLSTISYAPDSKVNFFLYRDEVYVTGEDGATGDPLTPYNVDKTLDVSASRNILNMPKAKFVCEFSGSLWAANVKVDSDLFPDRVYKSSGPLGAITFIQGAQSSVSADLVVDSVRYLKVGMAIDVYSAGTSTKIYDLVISAVNKPLNKITFTTANLSFATGDVNTGTDVITLSSTTNFPTGTPVQFSSTTTLPTPLVALQTYYVINVSGTTIKLAATLAEALAGTPVVNLTAVGSGTHTISVVRSFADNDEIWLDGRKGKLTMFWNTDFPIPETSDWTAILPGADSSNVITGIRKSSNRLFMFTKYSGQKFDGANTVTFSNDVGCISHHSIQNINDDWLIWVDAEGRVWARNESSGQQEHISRAIYNLIMKFISQANLTVSNAAVNNNNYYLYLGLNDVGKGNEYLRVMYSFDDNVWAIDRFTRPVLFMANDDYSGKRKLHFFSNDGYLYMDDIGNQDHEDIIPLEINLGRNNLETDQLKVFVSTFMETQNCAGMTVKARSGGGEVKTVGEIKHDEDLITFPMRGDNYLERGSTINLYLSSAKKGDPEIVRGSTLQFSPEESTSATNRR